MRSRTGTSTMQRGLPCFYDSENSGYQLCAAFSSLHVTCISGLSCHANVNFNASTIYKTCRLPPHRRLKLDVSDLSQGKYEAATHPAGSNYCRFHSPCTAGTARLLEVAVLHAYNDLPLLLRWRPLHILRTCSLQHPQGQWVQVLVLLPLQHQCQL